MKLFLASVFTLFLFSSCSNRLSPKAVQFNSDLIKPVTTKVQKLQIAGGGSNSARQFIDDLADQITKDLKEAEIETDYTFYSEKVSVQYNINSGYHAILVLEPSGNGDIKSQTNSYNISSPLPNAEISIQRFKLSQNFYLSLYHYENPLAKVPVWDAIVRVNTDPTNKTLYRFISQRVIESFQTNGIIK